MRFHERRRYCVYILTNRSKTLYVGVAGNLHRRVWQHEQGHGSDFCTRYARLHDGVVFEEEKFAAR